MSKEYKKEKDIIVDENLTDFGYFYLPKLLLGLKKSNLNKNALAEKINVERKSVGHWFSGKTIPSFINTLKMCEILKIDLDYFFDTEQFLTQEELELIGW